MGQVTLRLPRIKGLNMALSSLVILALAGAALGSAPHHPPAYGYQPRPAYRPAPSYHPAPAYGHPAPKYEHEYCDPTAAPACNANSTLNYCLEDDEYPHMKLKEPSALTASLPRSM